MTFNLIMFILSTIGLTNIVVDSLIMEGFRNFVKRATAKLGIPFMGKATECPVCFGVYSGILMGLIWISYNPFIVIACGCAGSFISNASVVVLNWLEAATIVNLPPETK